MNPLKSCLVSLGLISLCFSYGCSREDSHPTPDLSYVHPPNPQNNKLIIFVHGFGSDFKGAWTNEQNRAYWPELVADDPRFSSFAVLTASYNSPIIHKAGTIEQAAVALSTSLSDSGVYTKYSQIAFIAHSTGGLIVRRMLVRLANSGDIQAIRRVGPVFFFATPTSGAPRADLVRWISANPQLHDLDPSDLNSFLQSLDNDWEDLLRRRSQQTDGHPLVFCAYELQDTRIGPIVPALYSKTTCDEAPVPFDRDHFTLVKPADRDDAVYKWTSIRVLHATRRVGQVMWNAGETLGSVVTRLHRAYLEDQIPEDVRFSQPTEGTLSQLWIPPADYRRDSWGELFQTVASDHSCFAPSILEQERSVELRQTGPLKACGNRRICQSDTCNQPH